MVNGSGRGGLEVGIKLGKTRRCIRMEKARGQAMGEGRRVHQGYGGGSR